MQIFITITSLVLALLILFIPLYVFYKTDKGKKSSKFLRYFTITIGVTFIVSTLFGWWADASNDLLLWNYGFNFDGLNDIEQYKNISPSDLEEVKKINRRRFGIGWPLKVIMSYVTIILPYIIVVYLFGRLVKLYFKFKKPPTPSPPT